MFFCFLSPPSLPFSLSFPTFLSLLYFYTSNSHSPPPQSLSVFLYVHQKRGSTEQSMRAVHQLKAQLAKQHTTQSVWTHGAAGDQQR